MKKHRQNLSHVVTSTSIGARGSDDPHDYSASGGTANVVNPMLDDTTAGAGQG